MILERE